MKARPRKVENRIAEELNKWFTDNGLSSIERIPVLGREGPDFTANELKLSLDAKSRLAIPKSMKCGREIIYFYDLYGVGYSGVRLQDLDSIHHLKVRLVKPSKTVIEWIEKMGPSGGVILHWPHTPIKNAVFVMRTSTWIMVKEYLEEKWNHR